LSLHKEIIFKLLNIAYKAQSRRMISKLFGSISIVKIAKIFFQQYEALFTPKFVKNQKLRM